MPLLSPKPRQIVGQSGVGVGAHFPPPVAGTSGTQFELQQGSPNPPVEQIAPFARQGVGVGVGSGTHVVVGTAAPGISWQTSSA